MDQQAAKRKARDSFCRAENDHKRASAMSHSRKFGVWYMVSYDADSWSLSAHRPEHYFACTAFCDGKASDFGLGTLAHTPELPECDVIDARPVTKANSYRVTDRNRDYSIIREQVVVARNRDEAQELYLDWCASANLATCHLRITFLIEGTKA